jgi:sugar-specific transcriptional regulator TrmB
MITTNIYETLGISPNEGKIYESLVEIGESGISDIAVAAKIHRRNAYDAIKRLIDKGLVFEIFSSKENLYNAVDPDKLTELLGEKQTLLEKSLPELKKKFHQRVAPEEAYIYRGLEGQKNIWRDVLRVGKDNFIVGAKGGWFEPRLETARLAFLKEANRKKIKFHQLFDHEIKIQSPAFAKTWPGLLQYRFLPKEYSTNSIIHVFGDYIITYTGLELFKLHDSIVFFVIHSKDLAESYRKWFWYMWEQSKKD